MDYESSSGVQFSLREVWTEENGQSAFSHTSVSAYVDGSAYVGKLLSPPDEIDEANALSCLEPVPPECIHPKFEECFTIAPEYDPGKHYLKVPSFTYEDCRPGKTFVADYVLNEVRVLERLRLHPHPNLVQYFGCLVKDGRITHICLEKNNPSLAEQAEYGPPLTPGDLALISEGVKAGIEHLHSLGLAHNDITPENVLRNDQGEPVIIDFDGCLPFGEQLMKGIGINDPYEDTVPYSSQRNDEVGLNAIGYFLDAHMEGSDTDYNGDAGRHQE